MIKIIGVKEQCYDYFIKFANVSSLAFTELNIVGKNKSAQDRKESLLTHLSPHEAEDVGPPNQNCRGSESAKTAVRDWRPLTIVL